jgi:hypothetical protein
MEFLSIYDYKFIYVKGDANTVADALSRLPDLICKTTSEAELVATHPYNVVAPVNPIISLAEKDSPLSAIAALTIKIPPQLQNLFSPLTKNWLIRSGLRMLRILGVRNCFRHPEVCNN